MSYVLGQEHAAQKRSHVHPCILELFSGHAESLGSVATPSSHPIHAASVRAKLQLVLFIYSKDTQ